MSSQKKNKIYSIWLGKQRLYAFNSLQQQQLETNGFVQIVYNKPLALRLYWYVQATRWNSIQTRWGKKNECWMHKWTFALVLATSQTRTQWKRNEKCFYILFVDHLVTTFTLYRNINAWTQFVDFFIGNVFTDELLFVAWNTTAMN